MAKKAAPKKTNLKQGKYSAVITIRILPDEMPYYDALLERYPRCKNYTDAILMAVKEVSQLSKKVDWLENENEKISSEAIKIIGKNESLTANLQDIKMAKNTLEGLINAIKI